MARSVTDLFSATDVIPGTATVSVDIGGFETFTFTNGKESVVITRDEMWAALKP